MGTGDRPPPPPKWSSEASWQMPPDGPPGLPGPLATVLKITALVVGSLVIGFGVLVIVSWPSKESWGGTALVDGLPGQLEQWTGRAECEIDHRYGDIFAVSATVPATLNERAVAFDVSAVVDPSSPHMIESGAYGSWEVSMEAPGSKTRGSMVASVSGITHCVDGNCVYDNATASVAISWDCSGH